MSVVNTDEIRGLIGVHRKARALRYEQEVEGDMYDVAKWAAEEAGAQLVRALGAPTNETFAAIARRGYVFDGNLPSKRDRDALVAAGLVQRGHGYQWLTEPGVFVASKLRLLDEA